MRSRHCLLVGEDPGTQVDGAPAFIAEGSSGLRLAEWLEVADARDACATVNLFDRRPDPWDRIDAASAARELLVRYEQRRLLLCGRKVAEAFGLRSAEPLVWTPLELVGTFRLVAYLPHPSGRCRWYNEPSNVHAAREFVRWAVDDSIWTPA